MLLLRGTRRRVEKKMPGLQKKIEKCFVAETGRMCWMGRRDDAKTRPKSAM